MPYPLQGGPVPAKPPPGNPPLSHGELAGLLGSEPDIASEETWSRACELLLTDPRLATTAAALRRLTEAAGLSTEPLGAFLAYQAEQQLEQLGRFEWEHPSEVLETFEHPEDNIVWLEPLTSLAGQRLAEQPDDERLARIVERLRTALAGYRQAAKAVARQERNVR